MVGGPPEVFELFERQSMFLRLKCLTFLKRKPVDSWGCASLRSRVNLPLTPWMLTFSAKVVSFGP